MTTKQTEKLSNNVVVSQSTSVRNGLGKVRFSKRLTKASYEVATQFKYDTLAGKSYVSNPYPATGSPTKWTTHTYDDLLRVTQITAPDGSSTNMFYNETSKPNSALNTVGNTVRTQDAWGRERWARSDDFGRLVEIVEPNPNGNGSVMGSGNIVTRYTYDSLDRLTQINQGSQIRKIHA